MVWSLHGRPWLLGIYRMISIQQAFTVDRDEIVMPVASAGSPSERHLELLKMAEARGSGNQGIMTKCSSGKR